MTIFTNLGCHTHYGMGRLAAGFHSDQTKVHQTPLIASSGSSLNWKLDEMKGLWCAPVLLEQKPAARSLIPPDLCEYEHSIPNFKALNLNQILYLIYFIIAQNIAVRIRITNANTKAQLTPKRAASSHLCSSLTHTRAPLITALQRLVSSNGALKTGDFVHLSLINKDTWGIAVCRSSRGLFYVW